MRTKRMLSALLVLAMVLSMMPVMAFAADKTVEINLGKDQTNTVTICIGQSIRVHNTNTSYGWNSGGEIRSSEVLEGNPTYTSKYVSAAKVDLFFGNTAGKVKIRFRNRMDNAKAACVEVTVIAHAFEDAWTIEGGKHYHKPTCGHNDVKGSYADHTFTDNDVQKAATCIATGVMNTKCVCGATSTRTIDKVATHSFANYSYNNDATCTKDGTETGHCTTPGCTATDTRTKANTATGHSFAADWSTDDNNHWHAATCADTTEKSSFGAHNWVVDEVLKKPTCSATGKSRMKCSVCGKTKEVVTDKVATAHTFTQYVQKDAPTCTEAGKLVAYCDDCNTPNYVDDPKNPATGHDYAHVVTAATCTEGGYTTNSCPRCGDSSVTDRTNALGHNYETVKGYAATCEADGLSDGSQCSRCNDVKTAQTVIPKKGHAYPEKWTADGDDMHKKVCANDSTHVQREAHDYNDGVITVQPGKDTKGEEKFTCATCGHVLTRTLEPTGEVKGLDMGKLSSTKAGATVTVDLCVGQTATYDFHHGRSTIEDRKYAISSANTGVASVTPTSKNVGHNGGEYVYVTGVTPGETTITLQCTASYSDHGDYKAYIIVRVHDHGELNGKTENSRTPATCTKAGVINYTCGYCGAKFSEAIQILSHTPGNAVTENQKDATCTVPGSHDTVVYCKDCGKQLSRETVTTPANGHTAGTPAKEDEVPAKCNAKGSYKLVTRCTVCDSVMASETKEVDMLAHTPVTVKGTPATCNQSGLTDGKKCSVCGSTVEAQQIIPIDRFAHVWGTEGVVTKAATCTEMGEMTYTCTVDATHTQTAPIAKTGHCFETYTQTKAATCFSPAVETAVCANEGCEAKDVRFVDGSEKLSGEGHTHTFTWTKNGDSFVVTAISCKECGAKTTELDCLTYQDGKDTKGHATRTAVYSENIQDTYTVHVMKEAVEKAPTCTEAGQTGGSVCSVCGESVSVKKIPALGHAASGEPHWTWTKLGTEDTWTAYYTQTCSRCGGETREVKVIPGSSVKDGIITYTAVVELNGTTYTDSREERMGYTVTLDGVKFDKLYSLGDAITMTANTNKDWYLDGELLVANTTKCTTRVTGDMVFTTKNAAQEEKVVVTLTTTQRTLKTDGTGNAWAPFEVRWFVPEGKQVASVKVYYVLSNKDQTWETMMSKSNSTSKLTGNIGTYTLNITVKAAYVSSYKVAAIACVTLTDGTSYQSKVVYNAALS